MTSVHVWGIKRDMTPTLFQLSSRKHIMSGESMVCSVDQSMVIKLRSRSQPQSRGQTGWEEP